jgi:hypothetical protein
MSLGLPSLENLNLSTSSGVSGSDTFNFAGAGQNPWVGTIQRSDTLTASPEQAVALHGVLASYGPWALAGMALFVAWRQGSK